MSILIKGMDVPHDCLDCYVAQFCKEYQDEENERPYGCPLVEIPEPHGRLIDADVFEEMLNRTGGVKLKNVPTVIESEEEE